MNIKDNPSLTSLVNYGSGARLNYKSGVYIGEKKSYIIGDMLDANASQAQTLDIMNTDGLLTNAEEIVQRYREELDKINKVSDFIKDEVGLSVSEKLEQIEEAVKVLVPLLEIVNPSILEYAQAIKENSDDLVAGMEECCTNMNNTLSEIKTKITNDNKTIVDTLTALLNKINEYFNKLDDENP